MRVEAGARRALPLSRPLCYLNLFVITGRRHSFVMAGSYVRQSCSPGRLLFLIDRERGGLAPYLLPDGEKGSGLRVTESPSPCNYGLAPHHTSLVYMNWKFFLKSYPIALWFRYFLHGILCALRTLSASASNCSSCFFFFCESAKCPQAYPGFYLGLRIYGHEAHKAQHLTLPIALATSPARSW